MSKIKSILLVDDDPDDQLLFREALSEADNSVACYSASNGIDAIEKLTSGAVGAPDIIFMDVNMPRMNGIECLKALQKTRVAVEVPVVMYSTSDSPEHKKLSFENGAAKYLEKPNDFRELCNKLKAILNDGLLNLTDKPVYT